MTSITRGQCFGPCPVYSMVVHEDGIVDYEGKAYVKIEGKHRFRIDMDRVRALSAAFDAAGFSSFGVSYVGARICDPSESVQVRHRSRTVSHRLSADSAPPSLTRLEEDFDRIVGADEWIGTPKEREAFGKLWGR